MNYFKTLKDIIENELQGLKDEGTLPAELDTSAVTVEPPREREHGDVATNAAMVLAKRAGLKPRDLAEVLARRLEKLGDARAIEIAGPGFINLRLSDRVWHERLAEVLRAGTDYGSSDLGGGRKVNVEYVSANPTGPITVGHARGAIVGDVLASLLQKVGYEVTREYYINDAGQQVDVLARSAYLRYREALGEEIGEIPEGYYPGDYLKDVGRTLAGRDGAMWLGKPESEWLGPVRDFAIDGLMDLIRRDLDAVGIHHDVFSSERAVRDAGTMEEVFETLEAQGLLYTGVLDPPKGKKPEDWEPRPQLLFQATRFGDDVDRPLKKSDGSWTYFAGDMAYHLDKYRRGFGLMIDVLGADHSGYVKRMQAAVKALSEGRGELDVKICQLVTLQRGGQPIKMSKRAGTFVTLRDVVDEIGKDVVRFIMLTRKNDAPLDFDLEKVLEQSRDNPVFYVQYAHARASSVLRHAAAELADMDQSPGALAEAPLHLLDDPGEIALIRQMADWPRVVEGAAEAHEPHRLAFYLFELASQFHMLWNKGKDEATLRFLIADKPELTRARLALVKATALVIASGLTVFGVKPVEEMR